MASTLTPISLIPFIQNYISQHADDVNSIVQFLGVLAAAIASAVSEETTHVYSLGILLITVTVH